jgi:SAM-dependent methyltransferase
MLDKNSQFNWAQAWAELLSQTGLRANLNRQGASAEKFWDNYNGWMEWQNQSNYPGRLLERIKAFVRPEDTLLDIGAGAGAYLIPLAKICRQVTAVEPSPGQFSRLQENTLQNGIKNPELIPKRWEDVSLAEVGRHDIVLAAYSFEMQDIAAALEKMLQAARRYCFLIHTAGHDLTGLLGELLGVRSGPDYIYLYNVLYQLGYRANVEIISRQYSLPVELQMRMFALNPGLSEEQQRILYRYLETEGRLERHDDQIWIKRQHKDALIWLAREV